MKFTFFITFLSLFSLSFVMDFDIIALHLEENKPLCQFSQNSVLWYLFSSISILKSPVNVVVIKTSDKTLDTL
jgi:hypothetical protein